MPPPRRHSRHDRHKKISSPELVEELTSPLVTTVEAHGYRIMCHPSPNHVETSATFLERMSPEEVEALEVRFPDLSATKDVTSTSARPSKRGPSALGKFASTCCSPGGCWPARKKPENQSFLAPVGESRSCTAEDVVCDPDVTDSTLAVVSEVSALPKVEFVLLQCSCALLSSVCPLFGVEVLSTSPSRWFLYRVGRVIL